MADYALDDNVKLPPPGAGRTGKYPFRDMAVDESFEFPFSEYARVRAAASHFGKRNGMAFSVRKTDESTARCWRTR